MNCARSYAVIGAPLNRHTEKLSPGDESNHTYLELTRFCSIASCRDWNPATNNFTRPGMIRPFGLKRFSLACITIKKGAKIIKIGPFVQK